MGNVVFAYSWKHGMVRAVLMIRWFSLYAFTCFAFIQLEKILHGGQKDHLRQEVSRSAHPPSGELQYDDTCPFTLQIETDRTALFLSGAVIRPHLYIIHLK